MKHKKTSNKKQIPNSADLANVLWDTVKKVQNKKLKPIEANAIARLSREIIGISKLKLEYAKFVGSKNVKDTLLIE